MNNFYVYMYLDQENVPFYIGKGKNERWYPHNHTKGNTMTARKVRKLGVDNVKAHFLHKDLTEAEAFEWEAYWIKYLGRKDNGTGQLTNHTDGGEGESHPAWNKGLKTGPTGRPAWNRGKKLSKEYCRKLSESHKGYKTPEDTKRKISNSVKQSWIARKGGQN